MKSKFKKFKENKKLYILVKVILSLVLIYSVLRVTIYFYDLSSFAFDKEMYRKFLTDFPDKKYLFRVDVIILLPIFLLFMLLLSSVAWGTIYFVIVAGIFCTVNYEKVLQRSEPLYLSDFCVIFDFDLVKKLVGSPFLFYFLLLLILSMIVFVFYRFGNFIFKNGLKKNVLQFFSILIMVLSLFVIKDFGKATNIIRIRADKYAQWISYDPLLNSKVNSSIMNFVYNIPGEVMDEPDNYSENAVKKITDKFKISAQNETVNSKKNILYIMSESFSDPEKIKGIKMSEDPIEIFKSIQNNSILGESLSNTFGGGTANSEYEALTGFSLSALRPEINTPYTMALDNLKKIPTAVSYFNELKYSTIAIHPYNTSLYKRVDNYKKFGFSDFITEDTIKYKNKIANSPYISDGSAFDQTIDELRKIKSSAFIHLVTMQNHGPYGENYPETQIKVSGSSNNKGIQDYAQGIKYSSEYLAKFISELNTLNEETIIVFWGDHLPGAYDEKLQSQNDQRTQYSTPLMIYDTETQKNVDLKTMSPIYYLPTLIRYFGLPNTGFYNLLGELYKVMPAMSRTAYVDSNQVFHEEEPKENKDATKLREEYELIMYDIMVGKQYSLKEGFFEPDTSK